MSRDLFPLAPPVTDVVAGDLTRLLPGQLLWAGKAGEAVLHLCQLEENLPTQAELVVDDLTDPDPETRLTRVPYAWVQGWHDQVPARRPVRLLLQHPELRQGKLPTKIHLDQVVGKVVTVLDVYDRLVTGRLLPGVVEPELTQVQVRFLLHCRLELTLRVLGRWLDPLVVDARGGFPLLERLLPGPVWGLQVGAYPVHLVHGPLPYALLNEVLMRPHVR